MTYLGIDPGKSGSIAFIRDGKWWSVKNDSTLQELSEALDESWDGGAFAMIEVVHSSPQMGVKSAFTFGQSYGQLEALLVANKIPFDRVRPQAWQKAMGCMTKGNKNVSKAKAQELFPNGGKITHANADALLLAEYGRRRDAK
jgi:Holliday junction resolvasome RuvABC endonuclease subunit